MKLILETGHLDVWMILPNPVIILDPKHKTLEVGIYFLNLFFTIKIKTK